MEFTFNQRLALCLVEMDIKGFILLNLRRTTRCAKLIITNNQNRPVDEAIEIVKHYFQNRVLGKKNPQSKNGTYILEIQK